LEEAMFEDYQIIDLSPELVPGQEDRRLAIRPFLAESDQLLMHDIDMMSHVGAHIEAPFHYKEDHCTESLEVELTQNRIQTVIPTLLIRTTQHRHLSTVKFKINHQVIKTHCPNDTHRPHGEISKSEKHVMLLRFGDKQLHKLATRVLNQYCLIFHMPNSYFLNIGK